MRLRVHHGIYFILAVQTIIIGILVFFEFFPTENTLRKQYYLSEVATLISPHSLREQILHDESPYNLVDTRDFDSYRAGHIVGAISIEPSPGMVTEFKNLQEMYPHKPILIYCYTHVCLRGRKVGKELAKHGIYVQELGIGFNEWKNFWREWNYESEWNTIRISDYITVGPEPGVFANPIKKNPLSSGCSSTPGFSC